MHFSGFIFVISIILPLLHADCPLSHYPRKTTIGFLQAEIWGDPQSHDTPLTFGYPLSETMYNDPSSDFNSNCVIAINGMGIDQISKQIGFWVKVKPHHIQYIENRQVLSSLQFQVTVKSSENQYRGRNYNWKYLKFNFLHSQQPQFVLGTIEQSELIPTPYPNTFKALVQNLQNPSSGNYNPANIIPKIFISGLKFKQRQYKKTKNSFDVLGAIAQFQNLRKYSYNSTLIQKFTNMLKSQLMPTLKIEQTRVTRYQQKMQLSFNIQLTSTIEIIDFSYSYLIYLQKSIQKNKYRHVEDSFFAQNNDIHYYNGLQYKGMMVLGMNGLRYNPNAAKIGKMQLGFDITFGQQQPNPYHSFTQQQFLLVQVANQDNMFGISYFGIELLPGLTCQDCLGSNNIYQQYCVSKCPKGYIVSNNKWGALECHACNITNFFVPDHRQNSCVCPTNYYLVSPTSQCEACPYDCLTCNGNKCLTCDSPQLVTKRTLNTVTGRCQCPKIGYDGIGYYDDAVNSNINCQKCHSSCQTCTGPEANQCSTCSKDRKSYYGYCICPKNFKQSPSGKCECLPPFILSSNGECKPSASQCGQNQYVNRINSYQTTCECLPNFIRHILTNECIPKCSNNQFMDYKTNKCQCLTGLIRDPVTHQCFSCASKPHMTFNTIFNKCQCQKGYYTTKKGQCVSCPPKSYYDVDLGQCACIYNYYMSHYTNSCEKCTADYQGINCKVGQYYSGAPKPTRYGWGNSRYDRQILY